MKIQTTRVVISIMVLLLLMHTAFAASWPADSSGTELAGNLGTYEPSGIVYDKSVNKLFVVSDEGLLSRMNTDGSSVTTWSFRDTFNGNDFEGVAIDSKYVYVLTEYPYAITQFNTATGTVVQSWSLSSVIPAPTNTRYGLEGMTYIPAEDYATSTGKGVFVVGSQETGTLYFLDIDTSVTGGSVTLLTSIKPVSSGVTDLYYNAETNVLYALYGTSVSEMNLQGTVSASYSTPAYAEGVTVATACPASTTTIYLAYDTPASVKGYNNYPLTCPSSTSGSGSGSSGTTTSSWPASSSGTNVGSGLSSTFEPSGVVWNAASSKLIVVNDNGAIATMNSDGSSVTSWALSGDLEGVALGTSSSTAYVLNEYPFAIYTFDLTTGTKTATIDLSSIGITTPSTTSNGLEGIAFIPDGKHSYGTTSLGGIFLVGSSDDGRIYYVGVSSSGVATLLGSVQPAAEAITDMYYSSETELLYVLYGATLREMSVDGTLVQTYTSVPGTDPEGFTFVSNCASGTADAYIANDVGNTVMKYTNYPITCVSSGTTTPHVDLDTDGDGLLDAEEATYGTNPNLVDTDGDGLTDYQEVVTYGTNPLSSDTDGDGLTDYQEVVTYGTNALAADSDSDGLTDYQEIVTYGTNALAADSDSDGLTDYQEVVTYATNPLSSDTDGGSVSDATEISRGTDPLNSADDVISPNLISTYTIDTVNALVTVYYADGHTNTINPFTGTDPILVGLNYDNTVLVVTNGKRMKTYQNAVAKDNEYINKYIPSSMTLTITHGTSSDDVSLTYVVSGKTRTARFTLSGTNLVKY
jgi:uncharacterized protein YjiK